MIARLEACKPVSLLKKLFSLHDQNFFSIIFILYLIKVQVESENF